MKKFVLLIFVFAAGVAAYFSVQNNAPGRVARKDTSAETLRHADDEEVRRAFERRSSGVQVIGAGTVEKVLKDDLEGSRHQRFILRLASGQTLLIAHNIDLAPRVASLTTSDEVEFYGVYEWNRNGGTVHWTHHDPGGRHTDGWIKHRGKLYR